MFLTAFEGTFHPSAGQAASPVVEDSSPKDQEGL